MANMAIFKGVEFHTGDKVKIMSKIQEAGKTRIQPFEGIVMGIKNGGENQMFTVRKISAGKIGVERIWPVSSPWLESIEVLKRGKVRRAKIYYARDPRVKLKFEDVKRVAKAKPVKKAKKPVVKTKAKLVVAK